MRSPRHPPFGAVRCLRPAAVVAAAALLLLAGCATAPTEYREPPPLAAAGRAAQYARVFDRVEELVRDKYFDATFHGVDWAAACARLRPAAVAAPDDAALYAVLNRLCAGLKESHLVALPPRRTHELRSRHRAAIGVSWQRIDDRLVVVDLVPGGPAAAAGVQVGWLAVTRDGQPLAPGDPYLTRLGQRVTYGFLDAADRPHTLTLEPQMLDFSRRESRALPGGARYLRFDGFDFASLRWLSGQLKEHRAAPAVVLDLRQNPGGSALVFDAAVAEFFPDRVAEGHSIGRNGRENPLHSRSWLSAEYPGRVLILTGRRTGSAAEIFSHVLQHHARARLIGQRTAGAVIISRYYSLPGGGWLQVPVLDYVGLDGLRLEGRGVTPDVAVTPALSALRAGRDLELEAALPLLRQP